VTEAGNSRSVAGLVLAAGGARRFGSAKLLAPLRGRPLVAYALDVAGRARGSGLLTDLRVVVAPGDEAVRALAREAGASTIVNHAPDRGLSSSLRAGLAALADADAALVLLADQPLVRLDVLAVLVAAWHERLGVLIRPRYAGRPGEPGHGQLDSHRAQMVMTLLRRLVHERDVLAIVATHDPLMMELADHLVELRDGEVVGEEEATHVTAAPHAG